MEKCYLKYFVVLMKHNPYFQNTSIKCKGSKIFETSSNSLSTKIRICYYQIEISTFNIFINGKAS